MDRNDLFERKARAVGINHVALDVGDVEESLAFFGQFLDFRILSQNADMAFIDLGDQFIAIARSKNPEVRDNRHFGLVVDDRELVRRRLQQIGVPVESDRFLNFRDPWGNLIEVVSYENVQFSKTDGILRGMGLSGLFKNERARAELKQNGLA